MITTCWIFCLLKLLLFWLVFELAEFVQADITIVTKRNLRMKVNIVFGMWDVFKVIFLCFFIQKLSGTSWRMKGNSVICVNEVWRTTEINPFWQSWQPHILTKIRAYLWEEHEISEEDKKLSYPLNHCYWLIRSSPCSQADLIFLFLVVFFMQVSSSMDMLGRETLRFFEWKMIQEQERYANEQLH